jgi:hypothetical protein
MQHENGADALVSVIARDASANVVWRMFMTAGPVLSKRSA